MSVATSSLTPHLVDGHEAAPAVTPHRTEADVIRAFAAPTAYLDVGHSKLAYYRLGGPGPDLFFVHGWPIDALTFRRVLPFFTDKYTCHLIDLPGAGRTICSDARAIDVAEHGRTIRRAIEKLGLSRFAIVAHDSGALAARIAAADDARVQALVLGGTEIPGHHPWVIAMYASLAKLPFTGRIVRSMMRLRFVRTSAIGFGGVFQDPAYAEGEFGRLFVQPLLQSDAAMNGALQLMKSFDFAIVDGLPDVHRRIRAPVRLIWGPEDPFFPIDLARHVVSQFGGEADLVEIAGAKLFTQEDHPEAFASHALRFLERHFAPAER
jgi:pimeloyl-ACP methyl ester carboxylesterase